MNEHSMPAKTPRRREPKVIQGRGAGGSAMTRSYDGLRNLILSYDIKPNERINEVELAKRFGVSRTPVREALNRLVVERLLQFEPSVGFFRPKINTQEIIDLYELRVILETEGVRLAIQRAADSEICELIDFWTGAYNNRKTATRDETIANDEAFHERLVGLSHNQALVEALRKLNARIHFIRWADSSGEGLHEVSYLKHLELLEVLRLRDEKKSIEVLRNIIVKRQEEIVDILKEGAAKLYIS
ncbi:MAG: GntR family transcriptional regulator [Rhizobiaceae bacterium]|nr:GntR family transcriptional regulator [Rhizobiaceae bacterium]